MTTTKTAPQTQASLLDAAMASLETMDPCADNAGHKCRKCGRPVKDMEYIAAGLFLCLCTPCLGSAKWYAWNAEDK